MNTVRDDGIDIFELLRTLWKNALLIALVAVICGSAAFARAVSNSRPVYRATATLYVNNSSFTFGVSNYTISSGEIYAAQGLIPTYEYILTSRTTLEEINKAAGLNYSSGALAGMISTRPVDDVAAFEITVTSGDPAEAELIANTVAKVLPDRVAEIVEGASVKVIDYAIIPTGRSSPSFMSTTIKGMLLGAVLAAGLVLAKNMLLDQKQGLVRSADELRVMYPDVPVLAVIPDMRVSEKRNAYYSSYYGAIESGKKGGKKHG